MFLDFSPLLDTMMAPHRQTKRPVHAQRRSSFDLGELPEHLQALVLASPQLGMAELCAAASASKGLQALVQVGRHCVEGSKGPQATGGYSRLSPVSTAPSNLGAKQLRPALQEQLAVKASISERDFPKLVQLQVSWL